MTVLPLTADERAIYDRQLRIWGLESQTRIRNSHILITSVNQIAAELIKNLVLTGIGSLTILDKRILNFNDLTTNFFCTESNVGEHAATASQQAIQQLNPNVKIIVEIDDVLTKDENYFKQFDIVIIANEPLKTQLKINSTIRKLNSDPDPITTSSPSFSKNIAFFSAECLGLHGYFFSDLGARYNYIIQSKSQNDETITKAHTMEFCDLRTVLNTPYKQILSLYKRSEKSMGNVLIAILVYLNYRDSNSDKSQESLIRFAEQISLKEKIETDKTLLSQLSSDLIGFAPVCAIVGGILSAEIVKVISRKDEPYNNVGIYSAESGHAVVRKVGK